MKGFFKVVFMVMVAMVIMVVAFMAGEYKSAPTVEHTSYSVSVNGITKKTESYKDLKGTLAGDFVVVTNEVITTVSGQIENALN